MPKEAMGLAEVGLERMAEMGHPGQMGALKDTPHAACPPVPTPYAGVSMKPLCSVGVMRPSRARLYPLFGVERCCQ